MTLSRSQKIGISIAAAILPISACSSQDQTTSTTTTDPFIVDVQPEPDANTPIIPVSIDCGSRSAEDANDPEVFSAPHFIVRNDGENVFSIEHKRMPLEIAYTNGSNDKFIDAFELSRVSLAPTELPQRVNGSVLISYPGMNQGETESYVITIAEDGTIAVSNGEEKTSGVAIQSVRENYEQYVNAIYYPNPNQGSASSFIEPGKDEWDNVPDAPRRPNGFDEVGFSETATGNAANLNRPVYNLDPAERRYAGAQVFDGKTETACVAFIGDKSALGSMSI